MLSSWHLGQTSQRYSPWGKMARSAELFHLNGHIYTFYVKVDVNMGQVRRTDRRASPVQALKEHVALYGHMLSPYLLFWPESDATEEALFCPPLKALETRKTRGISFRITRQWAWPGFGLTNDANSCWVFLVALRHRGPWLGSFPPQGEPGERVDLI